MSIDNDNEGCDSPPASPELAIVSQMIFTPDRGKAYQRPPASTLHQLVRSRAESTPEAVAVCAPNRQPLTYRCLSSHIEHTAAALRTSGVERNDRVAVVVPNGPEMAVAFAAFATGATCAPLNPGYRAHEFEFYLTDLKAKALVVSSAMDSPARDVARRLAVPIVEMAVPHDAPAGVFRLNGAAADGRIGVGSARADDIALVLHTSGTTSRPKIVPLTHANVCNSGHNVAVTLGLTETDRCLNVMPLFHIHGLIAAVVASLAAGATVICTPGLDPDRFFDWMDSLEPTWYTAVPTMHQALLMRVAAHRETVARRPLRFIRSSSAPLPRNVLAEMEEAFATRVIEAYGMTEASHQMTSNPLAPATRKPGSVGVAAGPDVAIMDEAGNLLPEGQIGEVVIRGPNVTSGYENNPTANQSSFTNGWFRTGDQGRFDDEGYLYLTGRLKEIINRGGEKIAPKEVDDVLCQHPGVSQAVAFGVPHPTLGEDVAAAVVLRTGEQVSDEELIAFAAVRLADFKVPRQLLIVDEIPKGPTGKLQRIGLADRLSDQLARKRELQFVAPASPIETQVAEVWKELLKLDRVGVRDTFHGLGGDSLAMAAMISEVEARFDVTISIDDFLRAPTIETIVGLLAAGKAPPDEMTSSLNDPGRTAPIADSVLGGLKNRLFQLLALYAPGFKTTRVWLHRMRGVTIGANTSVGLSVLIESAYPRLVSIGNDVTIGTRVVIIGHLRDSTSEARARHEHTVRIEDGAYIGPGVIILPNVTVGTGAVVSAGSVVSRSVPSHTLARGNPAVPIARCGVSLGGGVSYEKFIRSLTPIEGERPW